MKKSYDFVQDEPIPWTQFLSAFACTFAVFTSGIQYGWSSPSLHKMESGDAEIHVTSDEGAWIATMLMAGAFSGCPFSVWILNRFSRKTVLLSTIVPHLISWILIIFAKDVTLFYVSRFIGGLALALSFGATPIYIGEISESSIRGSLGSLMPFMNNLGVLLTYVVAPYLSIPVFAAISSLVPIIFFALFIWAPKSPYFLLTKNEPIKAKESLQKLRKDKNIEGEFERILQAIEEQKRQNSTMLDLFKNKIYLKTLFVMFGVRTVQQLSGISCFIFYAEKVFEQAGDLLTSSTAACLFALLQLVSCFMASSLLDRAGRKPLLITSCLGSAACSALLGFCFYRNDYKLYPEANLNWLPMAAALIYVLASILGLGVVPYVLVGEIFPTHVKGLATCCIMMYYDLITVIVCKIYQVIADRYGTYVPFWIFTICCVIGAVFIQKCVPETKGICLEDIQKNLKDNKGIDEAPSTEL